MYKFIQEIHYTDLTDDYVSKVHSGALGVLIIKDFVNEKSPEDWITMFGKSISQDLYGNKIVPIGGGDKRKSGHVWHTTRMLFHHDRGYSQDVHPVVALYCLDSDEGSGRTYFADMQTAYKQSSSDLKEECENLICVNSVKKYTTQETYAHTFKNKIIERAFFMKAKAEHKLVQEDAFGKYYFYSPAYTETDLDEKLFNQCSKDEFVYKHRWTPNDLLVYNNLKVIHAREKTDESVKRRHLRFALT